MSSKQPYQKLGSHLKALRENRKETIGEVSGAVEIDTAELSKFEAGQTCPTEDIMVLLMNHFDIQDEEATKLWELAGYQKGDVISEMDNDDHSSNDPNMTLVSGDNRIVYTDMVHVMVNNYGVVMNFMQNAGPKQHPQAVARIGMSKEHARSVLEVLSLTLKQAEEQPQTKSLPLPKKRRNSQSDK